MGSRDKLYIMFAILSHQTICFLAPKIQCFLYSPFILILLTGIPVPIPVADKIGMEDNTAWRYQIKVPELEVGEFNFFFL